MKFVQITGAVLLKLAERDEIEGLRAAGIADDSEVRINQQGDVEVLQNGAWSIIGGLLGDYQTRIKKITGQDWS